MVAEFAAGWIDGVVAPVSPGSWANVAAFRCDETERLGRELGFPVAVVAVVGHPATHARWLSERWHGALRPREDWFLPFDTWEVRPWEIVYEQLEFDPRWMGGRPLPRGVLLADGCLSVDLPPGADRRAFARALGASMDDWRFERVAARPSQVRYRDRTGRPLEIGARYGASPASWTRPEIVEDLYAFRPRDLRALVGRVTGALACLVARSALGERTRRPAA